MAARVAAVYLPQQGPEDPGRLVKDLRGALVEPLEHPLAAAVVQEQ